MVLRDDAVSMVDNVKARMQDMENKVHRLESERNAALATVTKMQVGLLCGCIVCRWVYCVYVCMWVYVGLLCGHACV